MQSIHPTLLAIHELLARYVAVDDAIFGFSWRRLLPIPGIFRQMPFDQYAAELSGIGTALEEAGNSLANDSSTPDLYARYASSLLEAVRTLHQICEKLAGESRGNIGSYRYSGYRSDVVTYRRLVNEYTSVGAELNLYFHQG